MRHRFTYSWQATAVAGISSKFRHTSEPYPRESDAEIQLTYCGLGSSFRCGVFPSLWLKFRHNWELQSRPEWGSWVSTEANFAKLQLIADVSFQASDASRATNKPPMCMDAVYIALYISIFFILIMFSSSLIQQTHCMLSLIYQDTSGLGAGGSSRLASTNIWIHVWWVCEGFR